MTSGTVTVYVEDQGAAFRFSQPPQQMPWGELAIFDDPDGNQFGLREAGRGA